MSRWQMPRRASATYAFLAAQAATQYPTPAGDRSRLLHDRTRGSEDTPPLLLQLLEGARPAWWRRSPAPSPTCWTRRATGATSGGRRPEAATSPSPTELCLALGWNRWTCCCCCLVGVCVRLLGARRKRLRDLTVLTPLPRQDVTCFPPLPCSNSLRSHSDRTRRIGEHGMWR